MIQRMLGRAVLAPSEFTANPMNEAISSGFKPDSLIISISFYCTTVSPDGSSFFNTLLSSSVLGEKSPEPVYCSKL